MLSGRSSKGYRGFESLPLREVKIVSPLGIRTRDVSRVHKPGGSNRSRNFNEVEVSTEDHGDRASEQRPKGAVHPSLSAHDVNVVGTSLVF